MGLLNLSLPVIGQSSATEDQKIRDALAAIQTGVNGNLDEANLATTVLQRLGLNGTGAAGRGASIIPTSEPRANVAFGLLPTPDQVTVTLPTNGLIFVAFQAMWSNTLANSAQASIFVGANQARIASSGTAAPVVQTVTNDGGAGVVTPLSTGPGGLMANAQAAAASYTGDVTTGQIVGNAAYEAAVNSGGTGVTNPRAPMGGPCVLFAAAGTYVVSIQFLAAAGTTTVLNRKLWVWTLGF